METQSLDQVGEPAPTINPALAEALEKKRPRFFRAAGGSARGRTGRIDTERFADELMLLQECSQLIGERLKMSSISYAIVYDGEETHSYLFDKHSPPENPQIVGAMANRRVPMRELLTSLQDFSTSEGPSS